MITRLSGMLFCMLLSVTTIPHNYEIPTTETVTEPIEEPAMSQNDICKLVIEELNERSNYDVVFFTADKYGDYGQPMFNIGNHYFSSYK